MKTTSAGVMPETTNTPGGPASAGAAASSAAGGAAPTGAAANSAAGAAAPPASALLPTYKTYPFELAQGEGMWVWDTSGRRYLDFYGGHAVASLGHSPKALADALAGQAREFLFYSNVARIPVRETAARALAEYAGPPFTQVFFCNSGAEANEAALKVAIQSTGRTRVAALTGAFHGRTLLALSATDGAGYRAGLEPLLAPCMRLRPNRFEDLDRLDDTVAAVIVEPVQSMAGVVVLEPAWLGALRERTRRLGIVLIYDEVQTGMGRLGAAFAAGQSGVTPDLVTTAKGLGGGVPVGALLLSTEMGAGVKEGDLGSTFGGGPLACVAVTTVLSEIANQDLHSRVRRVSAYARERLIVGPVSGVHGVGWLTGLATRGPAREVVAFLLQRGVLTGTSADPHVVRLLPPLIAGEEHVDLLREALLEWGNA
ncbi:MAG: aspartate aminotransferase family protein [Candidatus Eisenbacteria bacterium]|nr:aspartate aminotransferase family protein [Candidatus Eisenbacteria bacterium]